MYDDVIAIRPNGGRYRRHENKVDEMPIDDVNVIMSLDLRILLESLGLNRMFATFGSTTTAVKEKIIFDTPHQCPEDMNKVHMNRILPASIAPDSVNIRNFSTSA
ncbi:hypothetical protein CHS0354_033956 [Potamilus streckersoni]|uniref:Uncharacterized protein n=1 Tax=Potamilus streckersoni TaxID=2493646 RepID=A0AAE0T8S6_9BIVA|nr:hypothetical protein CHS0354_033956 [Potamilus streckersoni]